MRPQNVNEITVPYDLDEKDLTTLIEHPKKKWSAFTALGYKNSESSLQILMKYATSLDIYLRLAAIQALANHAKGSRAIKVFSEALVDENPLIVTYACQAIGKLALMSLHDEVALLMDSDDFDIRYSAIKAIDILWQEKDLAKMLEIFNKKTDKCRCTVSYILRNHSNSENWFALFTLLSEDDHPPRHRKLACDIAYKYGDEKAIDSLLKLTKDVNGHVRKRAAVTLDHIIQSSQLFEN